MGDPNPSPQLLKVAPRARATGDPGAQSPVQLSLTADALRRYPGEPVTLFLRVDVADAAATDMAVRVTTPAGLRVDDFRAPDGLVAPVPTVTRFGDERWPTSELRWEIGRLAQAGRPARLEFEINAAVEQDVALIAARASDSRAVNGSAMPAPVFRLECLAEAQAQIAGRPVARSQALAIEVSPKGRYLKHLPGIYESDELMGRLLMLFESFWAPIEQQISHIHHYLDPRMTPAALLPWLASWADWVMDERWPESRQRRITQAIVSLYRWRGTQRGLREMLAIYAGLDPASDAIQIVEHRANNFTLGPAACLGPGVALGTRNVPHTFSVTLRLPPVSRAHPGLTPAEAEREEARRRQVIEDIIAREKPAHTRCNVHIVLEDEA